VSAWFAGRRRSGLVAILLVAGLVASAAGLVAWSATRTETACGVVSAIEGQTVTTVAGFTLRTGDGRAIAFTVDPGRLEAGSFPSGHLREHLALASPVCVTYRPGEQPAVALRLDDGP